MTYNFVKGASKIFGFFKKAYFTGVFPFTFRNKVEIFRFVHNKFCDACKLPANIAQIVLANIGTYCS